MIFSLRFENFSGHPVTLLCNGKYDVEMSEMHSRVLEMKATNPNAVVTKEEHNFEKSNLSFPHASP